MKEYGSNQIPEADVPAPRSERTGRDELTGLMRQKDFFAAGRELLAKKEGEGLLAVTIDIENFRLFNEWYGHDSGDVLLSQIGEALAQEAERSGGLAGYMGQDDFCMLLPSEESVKRMYERIQQLIAAHDASMGFMPAFGVSSTEGLDSIVASFDRASIAANQVRGDFHTRIRRYDPSVQTQKEQEYRILSDFQKALRAHELEFYFQPQCMVPSGIIVGAEALARWRLPDGRMMPPDVFVPVLEKYGFVIDLDKYIWKRVCEWLHGWIRAGHTPVAVSVNVSQTDFFSIDVPAYFEDLLRRYELPAGLVKIEITESAYVDDSNHVRDAVQRLREKGFLILMDDFGSGYSSLNMLHELNVDVIKLDAQFLQMNELNELKGIHILETIINMTKTMAIPIIVEGVETMEQVHFLERLGCRYIQGFYYYRPMPAEEFERKIAARENLDTGGFTFLANQQFSTREFMDENIYSDSMLNNILGAAAFYCWDGGERANIVRFNQQFYRLVDVPDFDARLTDIQQYFHREDVPAFFELLKKAESDRLNGASGVVRVYRTDGSLGQFFEHFYFLEETENGKIFYGAMQEVTEIMTMQNQMRLLSEYSSETILFLLRHGETWEYRVVVHGLRDATGLDAKEFERELNEGNFYRYVDSETMKKLTRLTVLDQPRKGVGMGFHATSAAGEPLELFMKIDYVHDVDSEVEYILMLRLRDIP